VCGCTTAAGPTCLATQHMASPTGTIR
jgi:hypothetical protein